MDKIDFFNSTSEVFVGLIKTSEILYMKGQYFDNYS